ncbi:unnamed protein product [Haemonchus placei]|uniref:DUF3265 domain-containing protein n=1 Tax=Haemonchus placei TaxID=6290 RepID=A0A0N4X632_HAEPC|nr:unnamed protein product [Haemonchus placei]
MSQDNPGARRVNCVRLCRNACLCVSAFLKRQC